MARKLELFNCQLHLNTKSQINIFATNLIGNSTQHVLHKHSHPHTLTLYGTNYHQAVHMETQNTRKIITTLSNLTHTHALTFSLSHTHTTLSHFLTHTHLLKVHRPPVNVSNRHKHISPFTQKTIYLCHEGYLVKFLLTN